MKHRNKQVAVDLSAEDVQARIRANVNHNRPSQQQMMVMQTRWMVRMFGGFALVLAGTGVALAGNGFGQTAQNMGTNLADFGGLIQSAFYLGGFGLTGWGLFTMRKAHKEEGQGKAKMSHGVGEALIGGALIAIPTFAGHSVNTMFSNATNASENSTQAQVTNN